MSDLDLVTVDDLTELRELLLSSPDASSLLTIDLREVVSGDGALATLPSILDRLAIDKGSSITVLSDTTPKRYHDMDVLDAVIEALDQTYRVDVVRVAPEPSAATVLADESTVAEVVERVRRRAPNCLVCVGSGTMVDIGKVVANELSLTHVVVQTAASVNGYADAHSVLLVKGVKRTTPSRWPDVLVIDPGAIARAPIAMTRSGLGDQISMFSAAADWYLSDAVGFDTSYSPTLASLIRRDFDELMAATGALGWGEPEAVSRLASCLTLGGLIMGVAGRTAPSSGAEHLISHLLEMHADAEGIPSASHGSQVGVASVVAAIIWRRVRERLCLGNVQVGATNVATREHVLNVFAPLDAAGALGQECWSAYERKATWIQHHLDDLRRVASEWPQHDEVIGQLLRPANFIATALRNAQAPISFDQLSPPPPANVVSWSLTYGHLLRDRFGVLDLAVLIGAWNPQDINEVLDELRELAL